MNAWLSFGGGLLLAAPAGLNPYLPLLFLAVMARPGGSFRPATPFEFLGETWCIALFALLVLLHILADKAFVPWEGLLSPLRGRTRQTWLAFFHDLGQIVLGPLGAALVMLATNRAFPPSWFLLPPMLGILAAVLLHTGKRTLRLRLAGRWGPFTNILLSLAEDVLVVLSCLAGLLLLR
ncbi:MAG: DUF4126 domain-containing protein [Chloroflexia bacterium]